MAKLLERGTQLGKYELVAALPYGGMGEIFLAVTTGPGGFKKHVVLKRIAQGALSDDQPLEAFLDEARITAALSHPNIVQLFELGETRDGLFIAMEFIAGQNLNQVATACSRRDEAVPIGFACAVAIDVCQALHYAHTFREPSGRSVSIIHRDVAHKNVMVSYEGVVKLLDFGIAQAPGRMVRTKTGIVRGTTGYMSPEQVRGEPLDCRTDLFSLGIVLHELLTGRRLFGADTSFEEAERVLTGEIPPVDELNPAVPQALAAVVAKSLEREREQRFASARELGKALEQAAQGLRFDTEQRSAFMRELFAQKISAMSALFELSGAPPDSERIQSALDAVWTHTGEGFTAFDPKAASAVPSPVEVASAPTRPQGASGSRPAPRGAHRVLPWALVGAAALFGGAGLWAAFLSTGHLEERLLRDARELHERSYPRPTHAAVPVPGTFGEALEPVLDPLGAALREAKGWPERENELALEVRLGNAPWEQLPEGWRRQLEGYASAVDAALAATHREQAGPPDGLRLLSDPSHPLQQDGWIRVQHAGKLTALRIRAELLAGRTEEAVALCLDGLGLARDSGIGSGLLGSMVGVALTQAMVRPCAAALDAAAPEVKRRAIDSIGRIRDARPPFWQVFRDDAVWGTLSAHGRLLSREDFSKLPAPAAAIARANSGSVPGGWLESLFMRRIWRSSAEDFDAVRRALEAPESEQTARLESLQRSSGWLAKAAMPDWTRFLARDVRARALHDLLLFAAWADLRRAETGEWPRAASDSELLASSERAREIAVSAAGEDLEVSLPADGANDPGKVLLHPD